MKHEPFTSWDQVPLVCDIDTAARVLRRSVTAIERDLAAGCMVPQPMPSVGPKRIKQRRQWSKAALMAHLDGGYLQFVAASQRQQRKGKARHFFGKARSAA